MIHITIEYLTNEEKVVITDSKVKVLEAESYKLRKDLILVMDKGNTAKEKVKTLSKVLRVENLLIV